MKEPELEAGMELQEIPGGEAPVKENGQIKRPSSAVGMATMVKGHHVRTYSKFSLPHESLKQVQVNSMISATSANELL